MLKALSLLEFFTARRAGIEDFLQEEGVFEEAQIQAVAEAVAWQLGHAMKKQKDYRFCALLIAAWKSCSSIAPVNNSLPITKLGVALTPIAAASD